MSNERIEYILNIWRIVRDAAAKRKELREVSNKLH